MIEVQKPFMLVMRPPDVAKTELEEGIKHVQFAIELCNLQHQAGRRFMMEHPANATSWCLDCVQSLLKQANVMKVNFDSCMFEMRARDAISEVAAKTRIGFITNSVPVAETLRQIQ